MTTARAHGSRLTLVIPTRNRARFLAKVLAYYAARRCPYPMLVGDSSDVTEWDASRQVAASCDGQLRLMLVRQTPGATTVTSTIELLERVETPYTAWCGDDDFLVPERLQQCVAFLDHHPSYGLACGEAAELFVREQSDGSFALLHVVPGAHKAAEESSPARRLLAWARPTIGKNTLSVQRTEIIRYSWSKASEAGLDAKSYAPLHELCVNAISILQGRERRLRGLYHVMLRHTQKTAFSGPVDYFQRVAQWDWPAQVTDMINLLCSEILKHEPIGEGASRRIAEAVFINWLVPFLARNRDRALRAEGLLPTTQSLRERLAGIRPLKSLWSRLHGEHEMSLASFQRPWSFYHRDFAPIDGILKQPAVASRETTLAQPEVLA